MDYLSVGPPGSKPYFFYLWNVPFISKHVYVKGSDHVLLFTMCLQCQESFVVASKFHWTTNMSEKKKKTFLVTFMLPPRNVVLCVCVCVFVCEREMQMCVPHADVKLFLYFPLR